MKTYEEIQKLNKDNVEIAVKSLGELNKGFQAIAVEMSDYSKKAFEDSSAAAEKLFTAKSLDQAIEIQTAYARKAYDDYIAKLGKMSELYADLAKEAFKPVEKAFSKVS